MRYSERITQSAAPGKVFFLLVFFTLLWAISAFSQSREQNKMRVQAVKAIQSGRFQEAQNIYLDLLKLDPNNPDYNYEMGLAIFEEGVKKGNAAPYFDKAIIYTKTDTLPEMFLFAGKAEQFAGNFDIAIQRFKTYMQIMRQTQGVSPDQLEENIIRYIEMCENGKVQFENSADFIRIENLGNQINSEYPDYSPVVSKNENILLFTSRRETTTGGGRDSEDNYFEDIYYSLNVNGTWTKASNYDSTSRIMSSQVNTEDHDAAITYAADETQMYIYREEDVWISTLEDGFWTIPSRDKGRINEGGGFEPSVFITGDQQTMFVVSEISSGFGGRDIYITTKDANGNWKSLQSIGNVINTKYDEDAPFLTPDGNTLYFASNGHNSMGDYDIFKSVRQDDNSWGVPENLGPPINTPGHDRYFVTTDNGAVGYYASDRPGGYGETDIYRIILDCKAVSATVVSGVVVSENKKSPIGATISIFEAATGKFINNYVADPKDGKYEMRLKTETAYKFKIAADDYLPHSGEFTVPKQCDYYSLFQEIKIENLIDSSGRIYAQRAFINNAFFNIDKKIEEDFASGDVSKLSVTKKDSLRSMIAENYNPVELTNFVRLIDILDPAGTRIGSEVIGEKSVATVQTRDEVKTKFNTAIVKADQYFYNENIPEARANYIVANVIDDEEAYPKQQLRLIEEKMEDAPFEAFLATIPEEDASNLIVLEDPMGIEDNSSMIIPKDLGGMPEMKETPIAQEAAKEEVAMVEEPKIIDQKPAPIVEKTQLIAEETQPITEEPEMIEEPTIIIPKEEPAPTAEIAVVKTTEEPTKQEVIERKTEKMEGKLTQTEESVKEPASGQKEETIVFRNILFDFDKDELRAESIKELNRISAYLAQRNALELRIDGHADWIGSNEYNLSLSERRAKSAYNYLVSKGISDDRLSYQYFGESLPIAPNANPDGSDNPDGRQLNRRCEFKMDSQGTAQNIIMKF